MIKLLALCGALLFFVGCAPKNYDYLAKEKAIDKSKKLNLKLYPQELYLCGPSSIATLLSAQKVDFDYDDVVGKTFTPDLKGTLQPQMKAAVRNYGLIPYELNKDLKSVLSEISNDTPVLVLFNLGLEMIPVWHYSVATGFDKDQKKIFLSAPKGDETWMTFEEFERFFQRGGSWAIVALKPPSLPVSADENEIIKAILDMYDIGMKKQAMQAAVSYSDKNPLSYLGVVTLANIYFVEGDLQNASLAYEHALELRPHDPVVLNNLAQVYLLQDRLQEAKKYATEATQIGGIFLDKYKNTLEEIEIKLNGGLIKEIR